MTSTTSTTQTTSTSSPHKSTSARRMDWRLVGSATLLVTALLSQPAAVLAQGNKPPAPTSTPVPRSKWVTQPIKFGDLQDFTHKSEWFEAKIPENWTADDTSTETTAIVSFSDPTGNAAVTFAVFADSDELSKDDMVDKLADYVKKAFSKLTKFSASDAKALKNLNGAGQGFSYRQKLSNGKTVTMYGDAYYEQHDSTLVSIIVFLAPEEQYITIKGDAYKVVDSFKALPDNYDSTDVANADSDTGNTENTENTDTTDQTNDKTSEFAIGDLTSYKDSTSGYKLQVPEAWTRKAGKSNNLPYVTWSSADGGIISAIVSPIPKAFSSADLQKASSEFVKGYAKGNTKVTDLKVGKTKTVDKNSALTSFSYTTDVNDESVEMSAAVLVRQNSKSAVFLMIAIPTSGVDANSDIVDEILSSLTV